MKLLLQSKQDKEGKLKQGESDNADNPSTLLKQNVRFHHVHILALHYEADLMMTRFNLENIANFA